MLTPKGASEVIESLNLFTSNNYHIPYVITKYSSTSMSAEKPILTLKVSNVLGFAVGPLSVTATSITKQGERNSALKNVVFKPVTGDRYFICLEYS